MVDAGYVYAEGAKLIYGDLITVHIDGNTFLNAIYDKIKYYFTNILEETIPRKLRVYWYDAQERSQWVNQIPGITLRLGRVNQKGHQKGVDGAIIRDMLTLGRTQQISDIFIISGDEDLIEGVSQVKDMGISVCLMPFKTPINNMSYALQAEADGIIEIHQKDIIGTIVGDGKITDNVYKASTHTTYLTDELETQFQYMYPAITERYSVQELMVMRPRIPMAIDKLIFKQIKDCDAPAELSPEERKELRGAFWQFISALYSTLNK